MSEFTIKDSLVSFKSPAVTDITSAKVYFEPVQEGSGDPSPENVRPITGWTEATLYKTGKNLLNPHDVKSYIVDSENTTRFGCTFSKTGSYAITCFSTSGSSYIFAKIRYQDGTFSEPDKIINNKIIAPAVFTIQQGQTLIVYNGSAAGTKSSTINKFVKCKCMVVYDDVIPTAYEPYKGPVLPSEYQEVEYIQGTSNARIDTGVQGNNDGLVISGKVYLNKFSAYQGFFGNYIDEDHNTSRLILGASANGAVIADINRRAANSSAPGVGFYAGNVGEFKVSKTKLIFNGTEYSYGGVNNATANDTNILLNVANSASTTSNSELYRRWYYFRINDGNTALRNYIPCYRKSDNKPGMYDTVTNQFFASSGTEEFTAGPNVYYDTIPVSWENEAGTVYGGYVDLAKGEVVANLWNLTLQNASSTRYVSGAPSRLEIRIDVNSYGRANASTINTVLSNMYPLKTSAMTDKYIVRYESEIDVYDSDFVDEETALSMLQDFICVYTLKVPITHQLTPETIKTLKGVNNIWGDTNSDTEITYKVADALKMTQIRKNILLSQPHVETVTSDGIVTFKTDLAAPVKDCKVYFSPVQEGSGGPSPDNVRPITGWDGIELYHNGENLLPRTLPSTAFSGTFATGSTSIGSATNAKVWTIYVGKNQKLRYRRDSDSSTTIQFAFSDTELTSRTGAVIYNAVNCTNRYGYIFDSGEHPYLVTGIANSSQLNESAQLDASHAMISFGSETKGYAKRTDVLKMPIQFPQTIYGGYVDSVKGEVVEEWSQIASYNGETLPGEWVSDCDVYTAGTSPTIRAQVAYELSTPITYQLTPETIKTLKGINNIWSNANGNIEVKFWKH